MSIIIKLNMLSIIVLNMISITLTHKRCMVILVISIILILLRFVQLYEEKLYFTPILHHRILILILILSFLGALKMPTHSTTVYFSVLWCNVVTLEHHHKITESSLFWTILNIDLTHSDLLEVLSCSSNTPSNPCSSIILQFYRFVLTWANNCCMHWSVWPCL